VTHLVVIMLFRIFCCLFVCVSVIISRLELLFVSALSASSSSDSTSATSAARCNKGAKKQNRSSAASIQKN